MLCTVKETILKKQYLKQTNPNGSLNHFPVFKNQRVVLLCTSSNVTYWHLKKKKMKYKLNLLIRCSCLKKKKMQDSEFWSGWRASLHFTFWLAACMPMTMWLSCLCCCCCHSHLMLQESQLLQNGRNKKVKLC